MRDVNQYKFALVIFLAIAAFAFQSCLPVHAGSVQEENSKKMSLALPTAVVPQMKDGSSFIETMLAAAEQLQDYSLEYEITVFKDSSTVKQKGLLEFKKPKLMRTEEIGSYKKGAVVVLGKDGKARGHFGGALKFLTVTMDPDNSALKAANGYPLKDSDFVSLATFLKNWLNQGFKSRVTEQPATVDGLSHVVHIVEMYRPENSQSVLKRIYVNPETHLPVRWDDHDYKDPSISTWNNVRTNIGISDEVFEI